MDILKTTSPRSFCCYCGRDLLFRKWNIEHLIPKSKGGTNRNINKRKCCIYCNSWRGNKPLYFWLSEVRMYEGKGKIPHYHAQDIEAMIVNIPFIQEYIDMFIEQLKVK